jgi:hypothetical protein
MKNTKYIFQCLFAVLLLSACGKKVDPPMVTSVDPAFGSAEILVTIEGANLGNIETMTFSDEVVNFNTAYNSDNALLYRIAESIPLGPHIVEITTPGGSTTFDFTISEEAPEVFNFSPASANVGEIITIRGENFFEPLEVLFFDSIQAEITFKSEDSLRVIVPEGVEKGRIVLKANGGRAESPVDFFRTRTILVNDFDGNGMRSNTEMWLKDGFVDQTTIAEGVQNSNPDPIDNNFLKLTGTDALDINWIGGTQSNFADVGEFQNFGITTELGFTLLKMDINNNGSNNTHLTVVLTERDGSFNDFAHTIAVDWTGWQEVIIPLSRFEDLEGFLIDPAKVKSIKLHLIDEEGSGEQLEVNVDNIRFEEIL